MALKFVLALVLLCMSSFAQEKKKQQFFIRLVPVNLEVLLKPDAEQAKIMKAHAKHMVDNTKAGKILIAGPSVNGDRTFGVVIVEVETEAEAKAMLESDPAVANGLMKGEVLPFSLFVMQGR